MDSKLLVDSIVQQTTILLAQLSTSAGIKAPLAHIADQVFVNLAREIENQGVGRKVVADMFGMALRSYQLKVRRLTESQTRRDTTLWEAVYDYLQEKEQVPRRVILERFRRDEASAVGAVLNDLVQGGLVYCTGRGEGAMYGTTSAALQEEMAAELGFSAATSLAWLNIYRTPGTRAELCARGPHTKEMWEKAIDHLIGEGRVVEEDGILKSAQFRVELGARKGWEAAVFDHFRAVTTAIAAKVQTPEAHMRDLVGGSTAAFDVHEDHPHRQEVLDMLKSTREKMSTLWEKVSEYNKAHPRENQPGSKVYFYCGQYLEEQSDDEDALG